MLYEFALIVWLSVIQPIGFIVDAFPVGKSSLTVWFPIGNPFDEPLSAVKNAHCFQLKYRLDQTTSAGYLIFMNVLIHLINCVDLDTCYPLIICERLIF